MPKVFVDFGETWLRHHPGWTLHTWTDESVRGLTNTEAFRRSAAHSGKANVLRYEILLHHGGIYIDTDFECLHNLEPLLQGVSCFVGNQSAGFANNAIIGCVAGHPFLHDLVYGLSRRLPQFCHLPSIKQSGPYYLNEILKGRRDVTVFPQQLFYPYQWHERWRRHEAFPQAYAVHHWSLSWRKKSQSRPCTVSPALSVLLINLVPDVCRLRWALEALCEQTASQKFDVLTIDYARDSCIRDTVFGFSDRLKVGYAEAIESQRGLLGEAVTRHASRCSAPRILLLDSRCVAGRETIEQHAQFQAGHVVAFSAERVYPASKLYPFTPPLDYDALRIHSQPDGAQRSIWQDVPESCISVPRSSLLEIRLPAGVAMRAGGRWLVRELTRCGHKLFPVGADGGVIRLSH